MKLKRVISGGQTGADRTGLECARALGLSTGGWAPRGYRTEAGPDPSLKEFGLEETIASDYPTRTKKNAQAADATLWFGRTDSAGYRCTRRAVGKRPFFTNPTPLAMRVIAAAYQTINVAGNRRSTNPDVVRQVRAAFAALATK